MPENEIAATFLAFSANHMQLQRDKINKCCDELTEAQMLHRGGDHENSVLNLVLHLEGNIRQWVLHGIAGDPDIRQRDDEFSLSPTTTSADARAAFNATVEAASHIIATLPPTRLLEIVDPQPTGTWRHTPILDAIYKVVTHLEMHTGQIILLTKQLAAKDLDLTMPRKR